jgi:tRNA threonylcarbamoyladenosine biosynthesis protein TsaB
MKILAIEFSSEQRSVAIDVGGRLCGRAAETGGRTARAFKLIEQALGDANLEREEIECVAVGLGPGSYTGIRSAISLAQGWQIARPVRVLGVSSVDCLAAQAQANGLFGRVNILIDAQRSEFYFAAFQVTEEGCHSIEVLRLATLEQARILCADGETLAGPDLLALFPKARVLHPAAAALGRLAANRSDFISADKLEPIYLREASFVKAPPPRIIPRS